MHANAHFKKFNILFPKQYIFWRIPFCVIRRRKKKKKKSTYTVFFSIFLVNISTIPKNQWIFLNVFSFTFLLVCLCFLQKVAQIITIIIKVSMSINKNRRIHDELQGCFLFLRIPEFMLKYVILVWKSNHVNKNISVN